MFPYTSCDPYDKKIVLANYAFNGMPNALLSVTPTPPWSNSVASDRCICNLICVRVPAKRLLYSRAWPTTVRDHIPLSRPAIKTYLSHLFG